jgi:hypothetical protein
VLDINALPTDVTQLQRLLMEHHALVATQSVDLRTKQRQIEHLKFQLAKLRRFRFGQSSERLEGIEQMVLSLEELEASVAQAQVTASPAAAAPEKGQPTRRKHLPEHFERIDNTIEPSECACPDCGGPLGLLGSDTAEVLEVKTVTFTVTRHIRPKKRCSTCSVIVQAPAPPRPIEKSFAGASLLALILSWKYAFPPVVPAVSDFCPCGVDDQSHDADAVGWGQQRAPGSIGGGLSETRVGGAQYQRRRHADQSAGTRHGKDQKRSAVDLRSRRSRMGVNRSAGRVVSVLAELARKISATAFGRLQGQAAGGCVRGL